MGCGASKKKEDAKHDEATELAEAAKQEEKEEPKAEDKKDEPADAETKDAPEKPVAPKCDPSVFLPKVFAQFDLDDNGAIARDELRVCLRALNITDGFMDMWTAMDRNEDGIIELSEWNEFMPTIIQTAIAKQVTEDGTIPGFRAAVDVCRVFDQLDADKGGMISSDELQRALLCLGIDKIKVGDLMKTLDADGNGEVDLMEWKQGLPDNIREEMLSHLDERGVLKGFLPNRGGKHRSAEAKTDEEKQKEIDLAEAELQRQEAEAAALEEAEEAAEAAETVAEAEE